MDWVPGHGGISIAVRSWPGEGDPAFSFVHATGFCKEVWIPVIEELHGRGVELPMLAWDQRGHGDSEVSSPPFDWWDLARDALAVIGPRPVMGVGHSSGAAALVMAAVLDPSRFQALVLVEPIIFPPPFVRPVDHPLAEAARRRRAIFSNLAEVRDHFSSRPLFAGWDPRALEGFLRGGLRSADQGWELKCRPEVEAEFYLGAAVHGAWDRLPELDLPVLVVAGSDSTSHPPEVVAELIGRIPGARAVVVEGAGHMVPMQRPSELAAIVAGLLGI